MHEAVAVTIVLVSFMTGLYFIVAAGFSGRKASALIRARADLQTKLLDRLGSGGKWLSFAKLRVASSLSKLCPWELWIAPASKGSPTERILGSVQKGIILTLLGFGFLLLAFKFHRDDPGDVFMVIGTVGLSLGIGFLLSAGASYRLSKSMGILEVREPARSKELFSQS